MDKHTVDRFAEGPSAVAASNEWAGPPADPAGAPAGEAFPFHRLTRSWAGHRWWKPLVTGLLGTIFYLVFMLIVLVIGGISGGLNPALGASYLERLESFDLSDPLVFGFTMVSLILLIPALALAALITGPRPIGLLSSVHGRIRWGWLGRCLAAAAVIYSLSIALSFLLEPLFPGYVPPAPDLAGPQVGILIVMTLLLVPFQAAAEEYVFRGYLMQAVGSWLRHPAFAILLPVPLFVLGHGYDVLGQLDVALFAVFAGWITWRTGGLEAAIAAHVVNNSTIFLLGAVGLVDVNAKEGSAIGLGISVLTTAAFAVVVLRMFDRSGSLRRDRVVVPAPVPAIQPYAQYPYGQYPLAPNAGQYPPQYPTPYGGQYPQGQAPAGQYPQSQAPAGQYPQSQAPAGQYPPPYAAPHPQGQVPAGQYPPPYAGQAAAGQNPAPYLPAPDAGSTPPAPHPSDQHQGQYPQPAPAEQHAPDASAHDPQAGAGPSGATPSGPDTRPRDQARRDR